MNLIEEKWDEILEHLKIEHNVTDVSYNGQTFFAQDNIKGRYKLDLLISSDEVYLLIKKIANYMLQPF